MLLIIFLFSKRPSDVNLPNSPNTRYLLTPVGSNKSNFNQSIFQENYTKNSLNLNENENVGIDDESFERKEPLLLKRSII